MKSKTKFQSIKKSNLKKTPFYGTWGSFTLFLTACGSSGQKTALPKPAAVSAKKETPVVTQPVASPIVKQEADGSKAEKADIETVTPLDPNIIIDPIIHSMTRIKPEISGQEIGENMFGGLDLNGDGVDDFVISSRVDLNEYADKVYVIYGKKYFEDTEIVLNRLSANDKNLIDASSQNAAKVSENEIVEDIAFKINSTSLSYSNFDMNGDFNGDGIKDLIISFDIEALEEQLFIFLGQQNGFKESYNLLNLDINDVIMISGKENSDFGQKFTFAGDVNGDGFDDILASAPNETNLTGSDGAAYFLYGQKPNKSKNIDLSDFSPLDAFRLKDGLEGNSGFGQNIAAIGDIDDDGYDDVLIKGDQDISLLFGGGHYVSSGMFPRLATEPDILFFTPNVPDLLLA